MRPSPARASALGGGHEAASEGSVGHGSHRNGSACRHVERRGFAQPGRRVDGRGGAAPAEAVQQAEDRRPAFGGCAARARGGESSRDEEALAASVPSEGFAALGSADPGCGTPVDFEGGALPGPWLAGGSGGLEGGNGSGGQLGGLHGSAPDLPRAHASVRTSGLEFGQDFYPYPRRLGFWGKGRRQPETQWIWMKIAPPRRSDFYPYPLRVGFRCKGIRRSATQWMWT